MSIRMTSLPDFMALLGEVCPATTWKDVGRFIGPRQVATTRKREP
jgi:hypothetical protein